MRILLGELKPDTPDLLNNELEDALNCVPHQTSYGPFPEAVVASASVSARVQGAASTLDTMATVHTFAGTATQLYKASATSWNNVSRTVSYTMPTENSWRFETFGNTFLGLNGTDAMQVYTLGTSTNFRDQSASASAPVAHHVAAVRDFVMVGNIPNNANRVQWCQINNPLRWTPNVTQQSDFQDLPGAGSAIRGLTGGDFAAILTDRDVWRASYVGSPLIFRFDQVAPGIGCLVSGSVARFQNVTFFLSDKGFYAFDGNVAVAIGDERVDAFIRADLNISSRHRVSSVIDVTNKLYVVSYPSVASGDGTPDKMLLYSFTSNRWSRVEQSVELVFYSLSAGSTLDGLDGISGDLDALPFSLDSYVWAGGASLLSGFDPSHRQVNFDGDAKTATFITGEAQIFPDARAFVRAIRPLIQGNGSTTITARVGKRDRLIDGVTFGAASIMNGSGICPVRSNGRFQRVRMDIAGGFDRAMGFDVDAVREGVR